MPEDEKDKKDAPQPEAEETAKKVEIQDPAVDAIKEKFPGAILDLKLFAGELTAQIKKESLLEICRFCHDDPGLRYDYLADLCGLDFPDREERFIVVYQLYSMERNTRLRLKVSAGEGEAVDSVTSVWNTANWHEREVFDLFGVEFTNHPDLERILMPEDWEGHPLRKDYPLEGPNKGIIEDERKKFEERTLKPYYEETRFHEETD